MKTEKTMQELQDMADFKNFGKQQKLDNEMEKLLIEEVFMECQKTTHYHGKEFPNGFDKGIFFSKLVEMNQREFDEFMDGLKKLIHHKDTTCGLYAMDSKPQELLERFWQSTSDSCPLEATEAEKQEQDFYEFTDTMCFEITF